MPAKIKDMLKRSGRHNRSRDSVGEDSEFAGGVDLPDPVPYINAFDTDLFINDYGYWFAKVMFQHSLAMVIEKEHQGRACINPKAVLEAMEADFWMDPNRNDNDGNSRYPRVETFNRIDSARLTKSEEAIQVCMDELTDRITRYCRSLREEAVAELPAKPQDTLGVTNYTRSPQSPTDSNFSREGKSVTSDSDEDTKLPSRDEVVQASNEPSPRFPQLSALEAELPLHKYTSMLWEFAARSGKEPSFKEGGIPGAWICEASFNGFSEQATAQNKKKARHSAAKMLYQALQVPHGLS